MHICGRAGLRRREQGAITAPRNRARRSELLSELAARKEKEEQSCRSEESAKYDETRRAVEDADRCEIERARAEIQELKNEEARQLARSLRERGNLKVDVEVILVSILKADRLFICPAER